MTSVFCLALALIAVESGAPPKPKVNIFLTVPTRDGFTDATRAELDSQDDIGRELNRMSEFGFVNRPDAADIVVTVLARGVGSQAFGQWTNIMPLGKSVIVASVPIQEHDYWVQALLEAGPTYKRLLIGTSSNTARHSMGAWGQCALAIARDLQAWISVNAEQIRQLHSSRPKH